MHDKYRKINEDDMHFTVQPLKEVGDKVKITKIPIGIFPAYDNGEVFRVEEMCGVGGFWDCVSWAGMCLKNTNPVRIFGWDGKSEYAYDSGIVVEWEGTKPLIYVDGERLDEDGI